MKKKVMISIPMAGRSRKGIISDIYRVIDILEERGYEVMRTLFSEEWPIHESKQVYADYTSIPLHFLSKSLDVMSKCHAVYFCKGWESARGCKIEHDAAKAYGLEIIYE